MKYHTILKPFRQFSEQPIPLLYMVGNIEQLPVSTQYYRGCSLHRGKPFVTYLAQASVSPLFVLDLFVVVLSHLLMVVFLMS